MHRKGVMFTWSEEGKAHGTGNGMHIEQKRECTWNVKKSAHGARIHGNTYIHQ